ncbi:DUF6795 domain-containing protein [Pelomonas aquatica]|nr:DUF6795 domain-containing protein [Pelomonas aquatica]MCY4756712.1 hypothetical protein [Pelomonas aquatica]
MSVAAGGHHWRKALMALIVMLGVGACSEGHAMGKMVLFSAVRGTVLRDGKPVAGATVEREFDWAWKSEKGKDATTTDAAGAFSLPAIVRSSFLGSFMPHEPLVKQTITIIHGGTSYKAWVLFKRDYDDNGELDGKPIVMTCRLGSEPRRRGEVFGICELS